MNTLAFALLAIALIILAYIVRAIELETARTVRAQIKFNDAQMSFNKTILEILGKDKANDATSPRP